MDLPVPYFQPPTDRLGDQAARLAASIARALSGALGFIDGDLPREIVTLPLMGVTALGPRRRPVRPKPCDGQRPIVFVHGLAGHPGNFRPLARHLARQGRRRHYSIALEYGIGAEAQAAHLSRFIDEVLAVNDLVDGQVDLVAHSRGGIVCRLAVDDVLTACRVATIVTVGTPHRGTAAARYARGKELDELRPDSEIVQRLAAQLPWRGPRLVCLWSDSDPLVIPSTHARMPGAECIELEGLGHCQLLLWPAGWRAAHAALTETSPMTESTEPTDPAGPAGAHHTAGDALRHEQERAAEAALKASVAAAKERRRVESAEAEVQAAAEAAEAEARAAVRAAEKAARAAEKEAARALRATERAARAAEKEAEKIARAAQKEAEKIARTAAKDAARAARAAEKEAEKEARAAEKEARAAEKEADNAARDAEKAADRAERAAEKQADQAERAAELQADEAERAAAPAPDEPAPRWRRRKDARPEELISAALTLFAEQGYARTNLKEVGKAAGVSKATVYLYFKNKEDLLLAAVHRSVVPILDFADEHEIESDAPAPEMIRTLLHRWVDEFEARNVAGLPRLVAAESSHFPELAAVYVDAVLQRARRLFQRILLRGVREGDFADIAVRDVVHVLLAPVLQAQIHQASLGPYDPSHPGIHELIDQHLDLLLAAIAA